MRQQQGSGVSERGPVRRLAMVTAAVAVVCLAFAGAAQASVLTIGSVLPAKFEPTKFERVQTLFNTALPSLVPLWLRRSVVPSSGGGCREPKAGPST
jgi:hypothetical protein